MNTAFFIAKKLNVKSKNSFSRTVSVMAVISITIGISVLILSFAVLSGFKAKIKEKVFNFDAHIQVSKTSSAVDIVIPFSKELPFYERIQTYPGVAHVNTYAYKMGILQNNQEVEGVTLKGVGATFDSTNFRKHLKQGRFINFDHRNEIVLSEQLSKVLQAELGDTILFNLLEGKKIRHRKLRICGIYNTGLEDIDKKTVLTNIALIQRLNRWDSVFVEGVEIRVQDPDKLHEFAFDIRDNLMEYDMWMELITSKYYSVFEWLEVINQNVNFLIVMVFVIIFFNMIAVMSILIMERISMMGLLSAIGADHWLIVKIFWHVGVRLIIRGVVWGNLVGLGLVSIQYFTHWFPLDPQNYYMEYVPVQWDWDIIALVNISAIVTISFMVFFPTVVLSRVSPLKAIKFE